MTKLLFLYLSSTLQSVYRTCPHYFSIFFSLHRGSETDGRDQTIVLEECNQEGEPDTTTNSPSSASQGGSMELTVPI